MPRPIKAPPVFEDLTYKLIGIGYSVHKELGPAHREVIYQRAFEEDLKLSGIPYKREPQLPVSFKGVKIGIYVPDFVIDDKVIVELKAMEQVPAGSGTQLNYYLKVTGYRVGLLLNFGSRRLQIRRTIHG